MLNLSAIAAILVAALAALLAVRKLARPAPIQPDPVSRLWRTALRPACTLVYQDISAEVDANFAMFSVALNDALSARQDAPVQAGHLLEMSTELLWRHLNALSSLLAAVGRSASRLYRLPEVRALAAANFRSPSAVSLARRQSLLHTILFSSHMRFFYKLHSMARLAERITQEYEGAAEDVVVGRAAASDGWRRLDNAHYDLNTLWQESQIVFKAVLHFTSDELAVSLAAHFRAELARREAIPRPATRAPSARVG